jgi:L-lactate utilization protein LutC
MNQSQTRLTFFNFLKHLAGKPMTSSQDMIARFKMQISSLGGHFECARDLGAVRQYLAKLISTSGATRIVLSSDVNSTELFPPDQAWPFEIANQSKMPREAFYSALQTATIGISGADLAVAETGTLIIVTSEESDRLVTALPQVHVALLHRSRLVPSLHDAESYISHMLTRRGGIVVSLISASSRTTDIGGLPVLGVHGPKELHVLLLDQEPAGDA